MSGVQFNVGICLAASHFHAGVFPSIHLRIRSDLQRGQDRHSCARVSGLQFIARSAAISECSPTIPVQLHFARPETEDADTKSMSSFETMSIFRVLLTRSAPAHMKRKPRTGDTGLSAVPWEPVTGGGTTVTMAI